MIAYYVHHHGSGHVNRARAIAAHLGARVVGLSSLPRPADWPGEWVELPYDDAGVDREQDDVTAGGTVHWAPRRHAGLRDRTAAISAVLAHREVRLLVSDVSAEVALLARLHGMPVALMAQPGRRLDRPHRTAYDLAEVVLAPWPDRPSDGWPARWHAKTVHVGAVSRFDGRPVAPSSEDRRVLLLWGGGGPPVPVEAIRAAGLATPGWTWDVAGAGAVPAGLPRNARWHGWVEDPWPLLADARVVVTHAGQNALAEVAAARRPAVVIPQRRPFGEQAATARALAAAGLAAVEPRWPAAERWPAVLAAAADRDGAAWAGWSSGEGAASAAAVLEAVAAA